MGGLREERKQTRLFFCFQYYHYPRHVNTSFSCLPHHPVLFTPSLALSFVSSSPRLLVSSSPRLLVSSSSHLLVFSSSHLLVFSSSRLLVSSSPRLLFSSSSCLLVFSSFLPLFLLLVSLSFYLSSLHILSLLYLCSRP